MMLAPNFTPRRSGIVIKNYFNCEGGFTDCNCTDEIEYVDLIKGCFGKINNNAKI